jgi:hypothetical protein
MIDAVVLEGARREVDSISTDSVAVDFTQKCQDLSIISSIEMRGGLGLEKASLLKNIFLLFLNLILCFLKKNH